MVLFLRNGIAYLCIADFDSVYDIYKKNLSF